MLTIGFRGVDLVDAWLLDWVMGRRRDLAYAGKLDAPQADRGNLDPGVAKVPTLHEEQYPEMSAPSWCRQTAVRRSGLPLGLAGRDVRGPV
jgi:hypothetical protein